MKIINILKNNPVTLYSVLTYILILGCTFPYSLWVWPYSLLLPLQKFVSPDTKSSFIVVYILGLIIAFGSGRYVEKRSQWGVPPQPFYKYWWTMFLWILPIILLELIVFIFAFVFGWPIGE